MSFIKFTSTLRENPNQLLRMYERYYRKFMPQRKSLPSLFSKKILQGCKCRNVQFMTTVSLLLFFHFHTIGMHSESQPNWKFILNRRAQKYKKEGCWPPFPLRIVIQTEHCVFCFSWFGRKLYHKIAIKNFQIKNTPHVMQLEAGGRFIGSKLLKFMGKLDVIFSFVKE